MSSKAFISMVAGVLVFGALIGGSFVGGLAIGKGQEAEAAAPVAPVPRAPSAAAQEAADQTDGQTLGRLREQIQSGDVSPEDLAQLREQFQGQFGDGGPAGGGFGGGTRLGGGGGLVGTIEKVEGNTVTVNTTQGTLLATIGDDTIIQKTVEVTSAELTEGTRVTVAGARAEDGTVQANTIFVVPEGTDGFGGGGFRGGGGRPGGQP